MRRLKDGTPIMEFKTEEDIHLAKSYFGTLRQFLDELRNAWTLRGNTELLEIFEKYHIEYTNTGDGIPRVGIDNPDWGKDKKETLQEVINRTANEGVRR